MVRFGMSPPSRSTSDASDDVRFGRQPAVARVESLKAPEIAAINTLSQYCSSGPVGTPQTILTEDFKLSDAQTYDLLRASNSMADVYKRAFTYVPEQERKPVLSRMTQRVTEEYSAARYEPALVAFLASVPPDVGPEGGARPQPPTGPAAPTEPGPPDTYAGPSPRPKVPPRPSGVPSSTATYESYWRSNYAPRAASIGAPGLGGALGASFAAMAVTILGFGGVVFGAPVQAAPDMPRMADVSFELGPTADVGTLRVVFADGTAGQLPAVPAEYVNTAYRIVYAPPVGAPKIKLGDGIGLVGLPTIMRQYTATPHR